MKFTESFLEELRARTPLASLISRRVKLARSGRQMKGCCPFHNEKSPSFYVYEDGYHCFGCGAHGDAISFVMQTAGASFPEAVISLAGEAGLELPKQSPTQEAEERQRLDLHGVLEAAASYYAQQLTTPAGAEARAYLKNRGLTQQTVEKFGLGWAGPGRGALLAALARQNSTEAQLIEAGLLRTDEAGRVTGELFYNRVMFPIRDRSGRIISFGGRIMGAGQPKYVNGPETPLFSKRRNLYGLNFAREAARRGATVVAVEGYMDVIALHQGGFTAAVAPLGTALTTEQLEELWRLSPAPVLCFDGDAAGGRAAARAAQTALPALAPDKTIRLATLPAGEDPDTLVQKKGAAAFEAVLTAARPLDAALFDLLRTTGSEATPEQRTEFKRRLEAAASAITDKALASEYRRALLDRFFASTRRGAPKPMLRAARPVVDAEAATISRARKLTAILLHHPSLSRDLEEAYGALPLPEALHPLREAMLSYFANHPLDDAAPLDSGSLINHLHALGLSQELARALDETPSCGLPAAQPAEAETGWWHFYGLMHRDGLQNAVETARKLYEERPDDPVTCARFTALCEAAFRLRRGEQDGEEE